MRVNRLVDMTILIIRIYSIKTGVLECCILFCVPTYLNILQPTAVANLGPKRLVSIPPIVIPRQLATAPIDGTHMASTLRKPVSSVLLRTYDMIYGAKFPVNSK